MWYDFQAILEAESMDILLLFDCCYAARAVTKASVPGTKEVLAGCSRETTAAGPGGSLVRGSPFTHSLIKLLRGAAQRSEEYLITELRTELSLDPVLDMQSPNHVVLTGHHKPIKLRPLPRKSNFPAPATSLSHDTRVLLAVSLQQDTTLSDADITEWANWLSEIPKEVAKVEIEAVFQSHSSLILVSMPIKTWASLVSDPAYIFIGFVKSGNLLHGESI